MLSMAFWRPSPFSGYGWGFRSGNALSVFAISLFVCISFAAPHPAVAGPNASTMLSADMNPESGDQGQHARETKPGDDIKIEVYAKGVTGSNGFTILVVRWHLQQGILGGREIADRGVTP